MAVLNCYGLALIWFFPTREKTLTFHHLQLVTLRHSDIIVFAIVFAVVHRSIWFACVRLQSDRIGLFQVDLMLRNGVKRLFLMLYLRFNSHSASLRNELILTIAWCQKKSRPQPIYEARQQTYCWDAEPIGA